MKPDHSGHSSSSDRVQIFFSLPAKCAAASGSSSIRSKKEGIDAAAR
jgi:hypothetical protein